MKFTDMIGSQSDPVESHSLSPNHRYGFKRLNPYL
jgi:hypothetical protein